MSFLKTTPIWLTVSCLAWASGTAFSKPESAPPKNKEPYPTVRTRNIFDPERQPGAATPPVAPAQPAPTRADYAALTGTMLTTDKSLAFFSGSRPEFSKVVATSGTIAGAVVVKIDPSSIEVERDGKRTTIAVGQTVPLTASATPGAAPKDASPAISTSSAPTQPTGSPAAVPASDREALLRRMMEKRQQELK